MNGLNQLDAPAFNFGRDAIRLNDLTEEPVVTVDEYDFATPGDKISVVLRIGGHTHKSDEKELKNLTEFPLDFSFDKEIFRKALGEKPEVILSMNYEVEKLIGTLTSDSRVFYLRHFV